MNFYFVPTFQHICGVRVAELLWSHHILNLEKLNQELKDKTFNITPNEQLFFNVAESACADLYRRYVGFRYIPSSEFRKLIEDYPRNLGYQFYFFKLYEYHKWKLVLPIPKTIYWTLRGTLDRKKIAAAMVKDENLDILVRYKVACIYCLENDAIVLWNSMHVNRKEKIHEELCDVGYTKMYEIGFWTCYVCGIIYVLTKTDVKIPPENGIEFCPYRIGFYWALRDDNMIAAEYFFNEISDKEKKRILLTCNREGRFAVTRFVVDDIFFNPRNSVAKYKATFAEILIFLFSKMDERQLSNCLGNKPWEILNCFLTWPWQPLFMEMVTQISHLFKVCDRRDYENLLYDVFLKCSEEWFDVSSFEEFWKSFPNDLKISILENGFGGDNISVGKTKCTIKHVLQSETRTYEYTRAIFKHVSKEEKLYLVLFKIRKHFWLDLIKRNSDALKYVIYECIPTLGQLKEFIAYIHFRMRDIGTNRPCPENEVNRFISFLYMLSHEYEDNRNWYIGS